MNYEFYADVFFLTNCYLDFLAVCAVGEILRQKRKLLRYLLGCALAGLASCVLLWLVGSYRAYLLCMHFIVNPGMIVFCFFPAEKKIYVKAFCLTYFVMLILGGSVEWLYATVAGRRFYELCACLAAIPVAVFIYILRRKRKNVPDAFLVRITHGGKTLDLPALYDTGNRLFDPYVKKPVHIVSKDVFYALSGGVAPLRLIPFSSVGCGDGMIYAFTAERMQIVNEESGEPVAEITPAVLAAAENELFLGRRYQVILHSDAGEKLDSMPCGKNKETPSGHPLMPCGNNKEKRKGHVHKNKYTETNSI